MKPPLLTINFRDDSIMLDEGILDALGRPSLGVWAPTAEKVELPGRKVLSDICGATGWEPTWPRICIGQPIPEYQAVYFELEYAIPIVNNLSSDIMSENQSDEENGSRGEEVSG